MHSNKQDQNKISSMLKVTFIWEWSCLYLLFGIILRSPLFHVIRGLGDAFGLQSNDTSFPSVAMTRMGLGRKTGADAA